MERVKEEDFLFGEEHLIKLFGKDTIEKMKREDYEGYVTLRNCPSFMPSDIVPPEETQKASEEVKKQNLEDKYQ